MSVDVYRNGGLTTVFIVHQHKGKIIRHRTYEDILGKENFIDSVAEVESRWSEKFKKLR